MKRRNFIRTSAAGLAFFYAAQLTALEKESGLRPATKHLIDPIVPFRFYADRKETMLAQMREIKHNYGLRRFLLTAPMDEIRLTGFPSPEVYRKIGELVRYVKQELAADNIEIGWWCAPSLRSGKGPFQYITDLNGSISETSPCPLDKQFSETFASNVATVVRIGRPQIIQFEDDYELSWHPPTINFGCFCPLHLAEFAQRQNRNYSREELLEIFRRVNPESIRLRRAWAEMSRDTLSGFASLIREKIDRVAPETRISLCQSGSADFDGDFTEAVTRAFAGKTRPAVRLYGSSYSSDDASTLPLSIFHALYSRQHLPSDFEFFHESDSYPHNRFFMSAAKLKCLMTSAFAYGLDDSLFYATQYLDNPTEEKGYLEMFRTEAPRFSALKQAVEKTEVSGCEIVYRPFAHTAVRYSGSRPEKPLNAWINVTGRSGIPHTSANGSIKLIAGNVTETMDDAEIRKILSGSVFLDGLAAHCLCQRGFGKWIGAEVSPGKGANFCYEGICDPKTHSNIEGELMYNLIFAPAGSEGGSFYVLKPLSGAERITEFLDSEEKPVIPGMIRFINKLGGRVAITAFDLNGNRSSTVLNYKKKELLRQTIEWLDQKPLPVFVKNLPNIFCIFNRSQSGNEAVITITSLSSDPADSFLLDLSPEWLNSAIKLLSENGEWKPMEVEFKDGSVKVNAELAILAPVVLKLTRKK